MFDIGFSEILLFGAIALIVLGPEKLPQAARTAGQWYAKFRRTVANLQSEIEAELDLAETRKQMQEELAKIKQAEIDMKREMEALRSSVSELQQHGKVPTMDSNTPQATDIANTNPPITPISDTILTAENNITEPLASDANILATTTSQTITETNTPITTAKEQALKADDYLHTLDADVAADAVAKDLHEALFAATEPMYYRWFLLSDYDRVRRLPKPPFLPNYQADPLLHTPAGVVYS